MGSTCSKSYDELQEQWQAVTEVWLDGDAQTIQDAQISPLLQMLEEAIALNEQELDRARAYERESCEGAR